MGGNAYDYHNDDGILVHRYGPHIFHTNSADVFAYLSQFTRWRLYEHKVLACIDQQLVPIPINLTTVNKIYRLNLSSQELGQYFDNVKEHIPVIRTAEDVVVSQVGRDLYEKFFKGYTKKQWGVYPSELDKSVTSRIPTRTNTDDHYFKDKYQYMPLHGYTKMFEKMLSSDRIAILLNTDFKAIKDNIPYKTLIYTGPVDEFFDYCFGKLPYRSLRFEHKTLAEDQFQPVAVVNYPNDHDYTRVTEYKHITGQVCRKTSITYEYPLAVGDPYYPIPKSENAKLYARYKALADTLPDVHFVGRLGSLRWFRNNGQWKCLT